MARLGDIMSGKVFSVTPVQSVTEVAQAMVQRRVGSAVVIDGPWLLGIFTERDALRAAGSGTDLNAASVKDWMTKDPVTVGPDTDTEEAAALMATHGFRHLPVVDGDSVIGVVSLRDLLSTRIRRRPN
ncbi:MAG TPA: CBS domain-containing protein [Acidimicrobiia bacterium]